MSQYIGNDPQGNLPVRNIYATNKNYLINPTFTINQRVFAGGVLSNLDYGWDRWKSASGVNITATLSSGVMSITTVNNTDGLLQWVEDFGYTGQVTLSWEGTALMTIGATGAAATHTDETSPVTFNIVAGDNFWINATAESSTRTLSNPKLEIGSTQTPFEYPTADEELIKCRRYYERWDRGTDGDIYLPFSGQATGANAVRFYMEWQPKVKVPTVAWSSVSGVLYTRSTGAATASTGVSAAGTSKKGCRLDITGSSLTAGHSSLCALGTSAWIEVDAEL